MNNYTLNKTMIKFKLVLQTLNAFEAELEYELTLKYPSDDILNRLELLIEEYKTRRDNSLLIVNSLKSIEV